MRAGRSCTWLAILAIALAPAAAHAQLETARRHLENAEFERAIRAFDRAETSDGLYRADLVAVYEGRAMARWALGQEDDARRDLLALGTLEPDRELPAEAPPDLRRTFTEMPRQALAVELDWDDAPGRSTLHVRVENDDAGLVREVRTHVRRGHQPWTTEASRDIDIDTEPGEGIQVWVEAIGPGGAVVAGVGTALAPVVHGREPAVSAQVAGGSSDMTPIWLGVGIGAGVAAVVIIVLAVVFGTQSSNTTQPSAPLVIDF